MDPRVLTYLANVKGLTENQIMINDALIRMYILGEVGAKWVNKEPLFFRILSERESSLIAHAHGQIPIEE